MDGIFFFFPNVSLFRNNTIFFQIASFIINIDNDAAQNPSKGIAQRDPDDRFRQSGNDEEVDLTKYNVLEMPYHDIWGVLMRKDSPLAEKESIAPADLYDVPLILSQQESQGGTLTQWLGREPDQLNIAATYNLIFNASLLVDEGLGYAIGLDKIINTTGESNLCFRPLNPRLENKMNIIWKKYQVFSKPVEKFLEVLRQSFIN